MSLDVIGCQARAAEGGVLLVQGADSLKDTEKSSDRSVGFCPMISQKMITEDQLFE